MKSKPDISTLEGMDKSTVHPLLMFTILRESYLLYHMRQGEGNKLNGNMDQLRIRRRGEQKMMGGLENMDSRQYWGGE